MGEGGSTALHFIREYERRTNSHDLEQLAPLIAEDATYWFSDGSHVGRAAILAAIGETFETIQDEAYSIADVEVIAEGPELAVLRYTFHWSGLVEGSPRSGSGRGTNVAVSRGGQWFMLHEHLSV
ncbi:YybH family protein [Microbacterium sp. 22242]|uniref:YybH family protein n=1 Tax=Microbacterium sp. 22242 TaxID=3453896 RepID=UPI003F83BD48